MRAVAVFATQMSLLLALPGLARPPSVHDANARAEFLSRGSTADEGRPEPMDDALIESLSRVHTEPGELPRLKLRHEGKLYDLPLTNTVVDIEASGLVARVEVRQRYQNPFREPIETVYAFPLPENSAVTDLRFEIGDRIIESELKRRAEARKTYQAAKAKGQTAALLEQERPNGFTQSVANIPPGATIDVVIAYVQDVTYDANTYELVFPMVIGPRFVPGQPLDRSDAGSGTHRDTDLVPDASRMSPAVVGAGMRTGNDIDVRVRARPGQPIVSWSVPTHRTTGGVEDGGLDVALAPDDRVPNRDFVLRYSVGGDMPLASVLTHRPESGESGFFSLTVHPPTLDLDALVGKRELIFVLDVSGSMNGQPIGMSKRAIELALRQLRPSDTFDIISFAGRTSTLFGTPRRANHETVAEAMKWVDRLMAGGGTMMSGAIDAALSPPVAEGRDRYVFFLTDGLISNEGAILAKTRKYTEQMLGQGRRGRVFGFGVGASVNRCLLGGLAAQGRGLTVYASTREDPAVAVNRFFGLIDRPVLTDVSIDWGGLKIADTTPAVVPDLFASRPLVVHGRFQGSGKGKIMVRGRMGTRIVQLPIEIDLGEATTTSAALPALWARARIDELGTALWNTRSPNRAVIDRIIELSMTHRVMTPYTSFVAVDRERVVEGPGLRVDIPVEVPEGVDPAAAGARQVANGASVGDGDGDGLADREDKCPGQPEDKDGFEDQDGCPDPDNDSDGILDMTDQCPIEPEDFDGDADDDGCPDESRKVVLHQERIRILEKIYFKPGSATIRPISYAILDQVAQVLIYNPHIGTIEIEGHTDDTGSDRSNQRMSTRRAEAVVQYLVARGVDPGRLQAQGYGETRPIDTNKTREGRANNRRVEFRILGGGSSGRSASRRQFRPLPHAHTQRRSRARSKPIEPHLVTCAGTWISAVPPVEAKVSVKRAKGVDAVWLNTAVADVQACYGLALSTKPKLRGALTLDYRANGKVKRRKGVKHAELIRCIQSSHAIRGGHRAKVTFELGG